MITKVLRFKILDGLKKFSTNKIPVLGIVLLFVFSSISVAYSQSPILSESHNRAIVWSVTLNFNEPGSAYDYAIFGEATDANDGPPADAYDTVKPPAPMPSYIRAYFNDSLPYPYTNLWKDFRHYPAMDKIWNLSVQWVPEDAESPTTITISWNPSVINTSEYISVFLCTNGGTPLRNMRLYNSYSFSCPAFVLQKFKIICTANQAPVIPGNPSPANNSFSVPVNTDLSWTCSDPDGDTLRYSVYFGTSNPPPRVANNITVATYDPGSMSPGVHYYWWILARDIHDATTAGPTWQFDTNHVPYVPSDPSPSNNSQGLALNTVLTWMCGDPDSDPLTYDVYFGTSSTPSIVSHNQSSTTYTPGSLDYGVTYYWKIKAWDLNSGSRGGPLWNFKTNSLPNQPYNPSPTNGSTGQLITVNLLWSGGDPDSGDTVTYDVYFGLSSSPSIVSHNQSALLYDPPGDLQYLMVYYWKIVAWDNHNARNAGPVWHFTTKAQDDNPPYPPSNPFPANGSNDVSLTVDLSWTGGDPDPGDTVTYDVYFGISNPPLIVSHNQTALVYDPGVLESFTIYYWRVKAWDNHGNATMGPLWHFRTLYFDNPPYPPYNPSPANASTDVPITADLYWSCNGDPDPGDFVKYDVWFGSSFPLTKIKSNISGTSCTLDTLEYNTKYYWRIVVWDNHGVSTNGPLWSFTTIRDTQPPSLAINKPKPMYLYINLLGGIIKRKVFILLTTIIIGPIDVIATASDSQSGMDRVEFYVNNELKATDNSPVGNQYSWLWDEHVAWFPYTIKVIAWDKANNTSTLNIQVRKFW